MKRTTDDVVMGLTYTGTVSPGLGPTGLGTAIILEYG